MIRSRRAKIVATVGPASAAPAMLKRLFDAGVDTFRLNFSHGAREDHAAVIAAIRALEAETGTPIGILQDLQGPKIRLGQVGDRPVTPGCVLRFACAPSHASAIPLPHPEVFAALEPGHRVLVDDGRVRLVVRSVDATGFDAEVIAGAKLSDRKGVNLPDCLLDLPVLTAKDRADLDFGLAHGVDWVALSFVQRATDIDALAAIVQGRAGLVAKIEKPQALGDIAAIVARTDAVMIARGDLGVEIPPEDVPARQKEIVALCRRLGRPVIVATQMLESMTAAPTPTRAEASDVATAIYDGADAVMLSAESATGRFPLEAVTVMDRIIRSTEGHALYANAMTASREAPLTPADAIADTGARLAGQIGARCIMAYSQSGATGARLSARRPALPLVVMTRDAAVSRRMALVWGAASVLEEGVADYDGMVETARATCRRVLPSGGDSMVVLSGVPFGQTGTTNNIRVARIG